MTITQFIEEITETLAQVHESGISLDDAERQAARCLQVQILVTRELTSIDLDARMRKSGLKSVRAAKYLEIVTEAEKKPTEGALEHMLNNDRDVREQQDGLDAAEAKRLEYERYYDILQNAHVNFRTTGRRG